MIAAIAALALAQGAPAAAPCGAPEFHQFDFWAGHWDVYPTGKDKLVAQSLIEKVYGCGIRENWMPLNNQSGGSLSVYVPAESIGSSSGSIPAAAAPSSRVAGMGKRWSSPASGAVLWSG